MLSAYTATIVYLSQFQKVTMVDKTQLTRLSSELFDSRYEKLDVQFDVMKRITAQVSSSEAADFYRAYEKTYVSRSKEKNYFRKNPDELKEEAQGQMQVHLVHQKMFDLCTREVASEWRKALSPFIPNLESRVDNNIVFLKKVLSDPILSRDL